MDLKNFQRRAVTEVEAFLRALQAQRENGNTTHAALDTWRALGLSGRFNERENGLGEDLPTVCIKVPTGGGKTLLATQVLGLIHRTILADRNGAGLVLWVVPSSQIYRDTLRRLRDRNDLYRLMLEHALSRRIELWEKHEMHRLSPAKLAECLNILVVQLASTNRETKDQLKFFKDSGGAIVQHFPPESDPDAHRGLKERFPNLEMIEDDAKAGRHLVKTSVGNLVRICRPAVILDEGHKATSKLARDTIEGFNASIVVELSATPTKEANIVTRVSGRELLDEEMIKLPINVMTTGIKNPKDLLTKARDKRKALAELAERYQSEAGAERRIRPIVLVQVERTGADQRESGLVHSEDVREYLRQTLAVPDNAIAIKSSEKDDIEGIDLLAEGCPIEWIITKSALQEGWDCPFAYILVSLNNTGEGRAMTQLVGRILRQPYQERTPHPALNESYIYCRHAKAAAASHQVKLALEEEGYEGDGESLVRDSSAGEPKPTERIAKMRPEFRDLYTKPFKGMVYLPRFAVKSDDGYEPLDYFRHLISRVNEERFAYGAIDWPLAEEMKKAKEQAFTITLGSESTRRGADLDTDNLEPDEAVLAWIVASLRIDFLSHKQLKRIVRCVYQRLLDSELSSMVKDRLALVKFVVCNKTEEFIREQVDRQTEKAFAELFDRGLIQFYLKCKECNFEVPESIRIESKGPIRPLQRDDGEPIAKSLFDFVPHDDHNELERALALVLDEDAQVLWWLRNRVGKDNFTIQGYQRSRIYPDFVVQGAYEGRTHHRVLVIESKGDQLKGNDDTAYKRKVAEYFDRAGKRVSWQQLGAEFKDHVFRFQILDERGDAGRDWKDTLQDLLAEPV